MKILKNLFAFGLISFSALSSFAISESEASELLKKAQDNTAFYETDFCGAYSIKQTKPGESGRNFEAKMYRRDSASKWTILLTGPSSEKGKGYLNQGDNTVWFYDPADNRFTYSSARDKFRDTNANNSDFAPQYYFSEYNISSFSEVKLGNLDCVLFDLTAKASSSDKIDYPKLKLWVTKKDGLTRKKEDYSLSGKKLRTTAIPSYQSTKASSNTYSIPTQMIIQDNLKGKKINGKMEYEKTVISISSPKFEKVKDSIYTKNYLEMASER